MRVRFIEDVPGCKKKKSQAAAFPYGDWGRGYLEKKNIILMKIEQDELKTKQIQIILLFL